MKSVYVFGYGKHGRAIVQELQEVRKKSINITIFESKKSNYLVAKEDGFLQAKLIDVTRDEPLEELKIKSDDQVICVMDDDHLNVFLTLSLRSLYDDISILAISDSTQTTQKLKKAGADKVVDLYDVSANRIHNILKRPTTTKLLEDFALSHSNIKFREFVVPDNSFIDDKFINEVSFSQFNILLIGMIDREVSSNFLFLTAGIEHKIDAGDTLICIGRIEDLEKFEILIQKQKEAL